MLLMSPRFRRALGVVFVTAFLVAPVATGDLVVAMIDKRAEQLTERFTEALAPVLAPTNERASKTH
jgi:hypothetical protein